MTEFDDVIQLLKDGRPQATELELDEIKQRIRRRAADPSRRSQSMKSRFAILGMLVAGMLFSTAGAGLAIGGSGNDASVAQYSTPTPTGGVLGTEDTSGNNPSTQTGGGVSPAQSTAPAAGVAAGLQPGRQQAAGVAASQLPFTGFAAIPVLLGGLALLSGGLILRRRTRNDR
jgi:LPXTG-motif cell wall-anchored protein